MLPALLQFQGPPLHLPRLHGPPPLTSGRGQKAFPEIEAPTPDLVLPRGGGGGAGILWPDCWGPAPRVALGSCLHLSTSLCLFPRLNNKAKQSTFLTGLWVLCAQDSARHIVVPRQQQLLCSSCAPRLLSLGTGLLTQSAFLRGTHYFILLFYYSSNTPSNSEQISSSFCNQCVSKCPPASESPALKNAADPSAH